MTLVFDRAVRTKPVVSMIMVLILGLLILKNLLPFDGLVANCDAFGHIHFFQSAPFKTASSYESPSSTSAPSDEDCHGGKTGFGLSVLPAPVIVEAAIVPAPVFEIVPELENRFPSPDLAPPRKPPRA